MPIADPLELFRALNANVDAENYLAAARLCDPVSLRAFQRNTIADELPGIDTPAVLIAASADATFAAHLAAVSPRAMYRRAHAAAQAHGRTAGQTQLPVLPDVANVPPHITLIALGFVDDGSPIGRIVYRQVFQTMEQLDQTATSPRDRAISDFHRRRMDALPKDERTLQLELERAEITMIAKCRRQLDGGWLMLAEDGLLWSGMMFGFSPVEDDDDDDFAET